MGRASGEKGEGAGKDIGRGDEDVHHTRKCVIKESPSFLWLKLLSEKCMKSRKVPILLSSVPCIVTQNSFFQIKAAGQFILSE